MVSILQKMRQNVDGVTVEIEAERADNIPRFFTQIQAVFTVTGRSISLAKANEAVNLSAEKYCSAFRMLEKSVKIVFKTNVIEIH